MRKWLLGGLGLLLLVCGGAAAAITWAVGLTRVDTIGEVDFDRPMAVPPLAQSRVDADTPWQPCSRTIAGNGPAPSGRTSTAGIARGVPGVAFGIDTAGVAQALSRTEAAIATKA